MSTILGPDGKALPEMVTPGPGWGQSVIHECPPWHTADDHDRTLWQAIRAWWIAR